MTNGIHDNGRMTSAKRFEVLKLIDTNGKKEGEFYQYNPGWDDNKISALTGVDVSVIAYSRKSVFGSMQRASQSLSARVERLEADAKQDRLDKAALYERLAKLERIVNKSMATAMSTIHTNRISNEPF